MRTFLKAPALAIMAIVCTSCTAAAEVSTMSVRDCDLAASHPSDPDRVAPGLSDSQIDPKLAEKACVDAFAFDPERARTNYHLGRALYYQGRHDEAAPYLEKAAAAGYRQAIFVLGFTLILKEPNSENFCRAKDLWSRAAQLEHPWSAVHLVDNQLEGYFEECDASLDYNRMEQLMILAKSSITIAASAGRVEAIDIRLNEAKPK